jgi:phosphohistidine phosphatase
MRVYFLRHGKAAAREEWQEDDAARPLTDTGREEARQAARGLDALDLGIARIFTSPFVRARETAELTAQALGLPVEEADELAAGCYLPGLAQVLARTLPEQPVMLVGHEPDFSTLIGLLIGGADSAAVVLKKGGCGCVELADGAAEVASGKPRKLLGKGELVWLLTPRQLALMAPQKIVTSLPGREAQPHANGASKPKPTRSPGITGRKGAGQPLDHA